MPLNFKEHDYFVYRVEPFFEPHSLDAKQIIHDLQLELGLPQTATMKSKYGVMLASIVRAVVRVSSIKGQVEVQGKLHDLQFLGATMGHDNWTKYPLVGATVAQRTFSALEKAGLLMGVDGSGRRHFYKTETGKWAYDGVMTLWEVTNAFCDKLNDHTNLTFIDIGRPHLQFNVRENFSQRERRKRHGDSRKQLSKREALSSFGDDAVSKEAERVASLVSYMQSHPLVGPDGEAMASMTRKFSDGRIDVGGRLYGAWTNLESDERLKCTIHGEALVQLDISASQPTLLSALLGIEMLNLSEDGGWYDPYLQLSGLTNYGWDEADEEEKAALTSRSRQIAKRVIVELIGTGNVQKALPSDDLRTALGVTNEEWLFFREKLVSAIPALEKLEQRFDRNGEPNGYVNGPCFLSFHESQIMLNVLEKLRDYFDVPAYPVHDCLLVRATDWEIAYSVFVKTLAQYVETITGTPVIVPVSRKGGGMGTLRFRGVWNCSTPQHLFVWLPSTRKGEMMSKEVIIDQE